MSLMSLLRSPTLLGAMGITNLVALCGNTYLLRYHMLELSEDHEARMVSCIGSFSLLKISSFPNLME